MNESPVGFFNSMGCFGCFGWLFLSVESGADEDAHVCGWIYTWMGRARQGAVHGCMGGEY